MATIKALNGRKLLVKISSGGETPTFTHDCLINTDRGIAFAAETTRQVIPNCPDDETPSWSVVNKDGLSATITGAGMLHTASISAWSAWFATDAGKDVRVELADVLAADGGGHWAGSFKLTGWEVTGTRNEKATVSVTLESDGVVAWVAAT